MLPQVAQPARGGPQVGTLHRRQESQCACLEGRLPGVPQLASASVTVGLWPGFPAELARGMPSAHLAGAGDWGLVNYLVLPKVVS